MSEDMLELLDELEAMLTKSGRLPFVSRLLVNETEAVALLDRLRASIPRDVRLARQVLRERDQLMEQARGQAQRIAEQAQREAAMRLEEEGLLNEARKRSYELTENARREAEAIRRGADGYARDVLTELQSRLSIAQQEIGETLGRFVISVRKGLAALDETEPTEPPGYTEEWDDWEEEEGEEEDTALE